MAAAHLRARRVLAVYQPHGFAPTRLLKNELIAALQAGLGEDDVLWLPDIYYVGGTTSKDISAKDITQPLSRAGKRTFHLPDRDAIITEISREANPGDLVLVMGARDPSLPDFARAILKALQG